LTLEALEDRLVPSLAGPEIAITTTGTQLHAVNASSRSGNWSVVVYTQDSGTPGMPDIYAQVYDSSHHPHGNLLRVASSRAENSRNVNGYVDDNPAVAMDQAGRFVVVWTKIAAVADYQIKAQWFTVDGPATVPLVIDDAATALFGPTVAVDGNDNFVVAYTARDRSSGSFIKGATVDGVGVVTSTFSVPKNGGQVENQPSVAERPDGRFAIAFNQDGRICVDSFSPQGIELSTPLFVDASPLLESSPSLAMDVNGNCVVAWSVAAATSKDDPLIKACRINNLGVQGPVLRIDAGTMPSVAMAPVGPSPSVGGDFVVAYQYQWQAVAITEVTNNDTRLTQPYLDQGVSAAWGDSQPCISMNGSNQYFLTYNYDDYGLEPSTIKGRLGTLVDFPATGSGGSTGGTGTIDSSGGGGVGGYHYQPPVQLKTATHWPV
jgi:hypothetical protein